MSSTALATREDWLERRKAGIGGSDAAAVMGVSPWKSRYALWAEKTGLAEMATEETEAMRWGKILEEPIAQEYARLTGRRLQDLGAYAIQQHPKLPFMLCTHDRIIDAIDDRGPGVLSIKTAAAWKFPEWENAEAPLPYQVQIMDEMAVSKLRWGSFAFLAWGKPVLWFDVERNDTFIQALEDECSDFWRQVETGEAPPVDGSESTSQAIKLLYPRDAGQSIQLPDEAETWWEDAQRAKEEIKRLESIKREAENKFRAAIGDASEAFVGPGPSGSRRWSYRLQSRASYTAEASEYRVLREMKGKKR